MKVTDGLSLNPLQGPKTGSVGQQFEQQFIELMLKEMQRSTPGLFGEGEVSETFNGYFLRDLAAQLVESGGFGLAERIDEQMAELPMQPPLEKMVVTSPFGDRVSPISGRHVHHDGLDLGAAEGTPIRPVRPGVVRHAGEINGYGLTVIVDHGDGVESLYAHCSELDVQKGDAVGYADVIGKVGSTGRSTGPHLHLEVRQDGESLDPETFL